MKKFSHELYRNTLEHLLEGCQIIGFDWRYLYINDTAATHNRRPKEELLGNTYMEMWPGIEQTKVFTVIKRCLEERTADRLENEFTYPNGSIGWFELSIQPVPDGVCILSIDITERKQADLNLHHLTRLYATLSQINQTIVHAKEKSELFQTICRVAVETGKFGLAWIGTFDRATGTISPVAMHGNGTEYQQFDSININDAPYKTGLMGTAIASQKVAYCRDIQTDPSMVHWNAMAVAGGYHSAAAVPFRQNGEICGLLNLYAVDLDFFSGVEQNSLLEEIGLDLSFALENLSSEFERKQMARAQQEMLDRLQRISVHIPGVIYQYRLRPDGSSHFPYASEGICDVYGVTPEEVRDDAQPVFTFIHPDDLERVRTSISESAKHLTVWYDVYRVLHPSGKTILVEGESTPSRQEDGSILWHGYIRNITERKRMEDALKIREQQFRLISENVTDMIAVLDAEGKLVYNSPSYKSIHSDPESLKGTEFFRIIHPDDREKIQRIFDDMVRDGVGQRTECRFIGKEGAVLQVESQGSVVLNAHGTVDNIIVVSRDVTEKQKLEQQYFRIQRMESVGILAGGIAHDMNNIIAPIMLSLQLLRKKTTDPNDLRMIDLLEATSKRGAELVKQVLTFARGTDNDRTVLQVRHIIEEVKKFAHATFPSNITTIVDVPKNLRLIQGDSTQIHQILLNLLVNARDAMPHGGTITLTAENVNLDEHYARMHIAANPGPYIALDIKDNGTGMPPEIQEKIFEPFFTTKKVGEGTGLGLPTVYSIVKAHGGFINVYSEVGLGTRFKIYLPASESASASPDHANKTIFRPGNGELLLVVDDEVAVCEISKISLEANGYRVLTASDGTEAIGLYAQHRDEIALIITDMNMPFMDGPSLVRSLRKMNPAILIIGASGIADKAKLAEAQGLGLNSFLTKPYTAEILLQAITEVFDEVKPVLK